MKIVILDGFTINPGDLSWSGLEALGAVTAYDRTPQEEVIDRIGDADAVFTSKNKITEEVLDACPGVRFIGVLATGYDNIDLAAARSRGIAVCNVPGYSTEPVAQHTFALLLEICNSVALHSEAVQAGEWCDAPDFCLTKKPLIQLSGKSMGIIGYGRIGKQVAAIAQAFGMTVNIYSKDPAATLQSDVISLHCPATPENTGFVNARFLRSLKKGAILLNTARGALINETDLAAALQSGQLAAAGLDVVDGEPMKKDSPLLGAPNLYITPHIAWSTRAARSTICEESAASLKSWLEGGDRNRID